MVCGAVCVNCLGICLDGGFVLHGVCS
jgi:hypothetical protein